MGVTNDPARQPWLASRTLGGEAVAAGGVTVTPQSRALLLHLRGGALVWHRPIAVFVTRDGQTKRLSIYDATRLAQSAVVGASLLLAIVAWLLARMHKEHRS